MRTNGIQALETYLLTSIWIFEHICRSLWCQQKIKLASNSQCSKSSLLIAAFTVFENSLGKCKKVQHFYYYKKWPPYQTAFRLSFQLFARVQNTKSITEISEHQLRSGIGRAHMNFQNGFNLSSIKKSKQLSYSMRTFDKSVITTFLYWDYLERKKSEVYDVFWKMIPKQTM